MYKDCPECGSKDYRVIEQMSTCLGHSSDWDPNVVTTVCLCSKCGHEYGYAEQNGKEYVYPDYEDGEYIFNNDTTTFTPTIISD